MILTPEVITALISVFSALSIVIFKDVVLSAVNERRNSQRALLQMRLEQAYTPLAHLAFILLQTDSSGTKAQTRQDIALVLRNYRHLLSEQAAAAFYTLLEDENTGAYLLQQYFQPELSYLKEEYYHRWHSHYRQGVKNGPYIGNDDDAYATATMTVAGLQGT